MNKKINARTASAFVIANMIGTGVFTSLGFQLLTTTSPVSIVLLWLIGGLTALCGAVVYSELGAAMPRSGGEYNFLSVIYHPFVGFLSGWSSLIVGFAAPVALACMALSSYVCNIFPSIPEMWLALGVLTVITVLHAFNPRIGITAQNLLTAAKLLIIATFIVVGFIVEPGGASNFEGIGQFQPSELFTTSFAVSLIWVYYAYSGWNSAAYISGDIVNPRRNVPLALVSSTLVVIVLYVLLNVVFIRTTPIAEMAGEVEIGLISARHIFGTTGGNVVGLLIALMLTSSISSMVYVGPRVGVTMGEDHRLFRFLTRRNAQDCPSSAIWAQWAISALLILTGSFRVVTQYTGIIISLFALLTVVGVFVHRRRFPEAERPYRTHLYPLPPLLFGIVFVWSIVYLMFDDFDQTFVSHSQDAPWTTIMSFGTLLIGAAIWWIEKKAVR